jgi:putative NIF3 family GTP cyclohydrolase 1 type 2
MHLTEIIPLLKNRLSPEIFTLDEEFYGIQYGKTDNNKVIKKVLLTLDLSLNVIHFAITSKINLIVSYRGLIDKPIRYFNQHIVSKFTLLSKYPIDIFVLNSSFIAAEGGISDTIMEALFLELDKNFEISKNNGDVVPIGRISLPKNYPNYMNTFSLENLLKRVKANLDVQSVSYVGQLDKRINKICIIGGKLINTKLLEKALHYGCDCYISCKINHNQAIFANDLGISLIKIPSYNCEIKALRKLSNILSLEFPMDDIFLYESKNPINSY